MDPPFMESLQKLRDLCDFPFAINSGYRCYEHNKEVGGQPGSKHLAGRAADIAAPAAWMRRKIMESADACGLHGIGVGMNFIHVDNRDHPARWTYPSGK